MPLYLIDEKDDIVLLLIFNRTKVNTKEASKVKLKGVV